jgi:hypothetical protein
MKIRFTENQFSKLVNNILLEQGWLGNMKKSFGLIDDFKPIVKSIDNYKMSLKQSPEFFSQLNNFYKKAIQNKDINQIDEMVATIFHIFNPKGKKELEKSAIDETRKLLDAFSQLNGKQDFKDLKNSILLKNNNIYYKSFDQRTIPSRFGEEYADGLSEYNALVNMYNANPKNVVKPIGVVKDAKGNIVGFNLEKIQKNAELYRKENGEKMRFLYRRWLKEKRTSDPTYSFLLRIRSRLYWYFKNNNMNYKINKDDMKMIGCSPTDLKLHLETQFVDGMSWDNYGQKGWHIDHIIPLSSAKTVEDVLTLNHYTNLQPLWETDNRKKGKKII